jgi:serine/threonine-protein kinase SRPK3
MIIDSTIQIFQLATNEALFPVMTFCSTAEETRHNLRALIQGILGKGYKSFADHVGERLPSDFTSKDREEFVSFLSSMLQQSPQHRSSTGELLTHKFLVC